MIARRLPRATTAGPIVVCLLVLWSLGASAVVASVQVDEQRDLDSGSALRIEIPYGDVEIVGGDHQTVRVTGSVEPPLRGVRVFREAGGMEVRPRYALMERLRRLVGAPPPFEARLRIEVPRDVRLFVVARDARLVIDGVTGPVGIYVVASDVAVRGEPQRLDLETVSGSVSFDGQTGSIESVTMSGGLRITGNADRLRAESVTGRVDVAGADLPEAVVRTVSGEVKFRVPEDGAELDVRTESGDVTIARSLDSTELNLDLETRDSEVIDEVGELEPVTDERGWRVLRQPARSQSPRIRVSTRSGLIRLVAR